MKRLLSLLLFLSITSLSSCRIEGDEEITLHADGSGLIRAYYRLPEKAFSRAQSQAVCDGLVALCERTEGLEAIEHRHLDAGGEHFGPKFQSLQLQLSFDSKKTIENIKLSAEPKDKKTLQTIQTIIGHIDLSITGVSAKLQRSVELNPILQDVSPSLLGDSSFSYAIHFPNKTTTSNAHWSSADGKSLHWKFLLREYYNKPMNLQATAPIPIPKWLWAIAILAIGCVLFWGYRMVYKQAKVQS